MFLPTYLVCSLMEKILLKIIQISKTHFKNIFCKMLHLELQDQEPDPDPVLKFFRNG
jgi:hypothetical protein